VLTDFRQTPERTSKYL